MTASSVDGVADLTAREMRAWQALLHAHRDVTRKLDHDLRLEHGLTLDQYDVLLRLVRAPGRSLPMMLLAERVMAPPSTLTRRVDRLVAEGLVERRRLTSDTRSIVAHLTDRGRRLLVRASHTHLRGIHDYFTSRLNGGQLDDIAAALEVISGPHEPH